MSRPPCSKGPRERKSPKRSAWRSIWGGPVGHVREPRAGRVRAVRRGRQVGRPRRLIGVLRLHQAQAPVERAQHPGKIVAALQDQSRRRDHAIGALPPRKLRRLLDAVERAFRTRDGTPRRRPSPSACRWRSRAIRRWRLCVRRQSRIWHSSRRSKAMPPRRLSDVCVAASLAGQRQDYGLRSL